MKKIPLILILISAVGCRVHNQTLISEPLAWWKFDEAAGSIVKNSGTAGARCDGRSNNMDTTNWVAGPLTSPALYFDGKDQDVETPPLNLFSNTVTITAWIKSRGNLPAYAGIVFCRDGDTIAGIGSGSTGDPDYKPNQELYYGWNDVTETWAWHSGLIITEGKWVFVALVLEPARATLYLAEDGNLRSATNNTPHDIEEFNGALRIGNDKKPGHPPRCFKGCIDDVRIYDLPLPEKNIMFLANITPGNS